MVVGIKDKKYNSSYEYHERDASNDAGLGTAGMFAVGTGAAVKYGPGVVQGTVKGATTLGTKAVEGVLKTDVRIGSAFGRGAAGTGAVTLKGLAKSGAGRVLGPAVTVAMAGPDLINGGKKIYNGEKGGGRQIGKAVAETSGALAGFWLGFTAGSVVLGVGNIVGGIGGAIGGYLLSEGAGKAVDLATGEDDQQAGQRYEKETRQELAAVIQANFTEMTQDLAELHAWDAGTDSAQIAAKEAKIKEIEGHIKRTIKANSKHLAIMEAAGDISPTDVLDTNKAMLAEWNKVNPAAIKAQAALAAVELEKTNQANAEAAVVASRQGIYEAATNDLGVNGNRVVDATEEAMYKAILASNGNMVAGDDNIDKELQVALQTNAVKSDGNGNVVISGAAQGVQDMLIPENVFAGAIQDLSVALEGNGGADFASMGQQNEAGVSVRTT
ncbi:MAG: hypothetical protein P8P30_05525 [Rickettsiales bacterium]|nr:hypothetical protein [Rickettsiales bacterium]